jgi:hypothetical protein
LRTVYRMQVVHNLEDVKRKMCLRDLSEGTHFRENEIQLLYNEMCRHKPFDQSPINISLKEDEFTRVIEHLIRMIEDGFYSSMPKSTSRVLDPTFKRNLFKYGRKVSSNAGAEDADFAALLETLNLLLKKKGRRRIEFLFSLYDSDDDRKLLLSEYREFIVGVLSFWSCTYQGSPESLEQNLEHVVVQLESMLTLSSNQTVELNDAILLLLSQPILTDFLNTIFNLPVGCLKLDAKRISHTNVLDEALFGLHH